MAERTVRVPNISCGHCVRTIERELGELPGVTAVAAEPAGRTVRVAWDEARTDWDQIRSLLEEIHYPPAD